MADNNGLTPDDLIMATDADLGEPLDMESALRATQAQRDFERVRGVGQFVKDIAIPAFGAETGAGAAKRWVLPRLAGAAARTYGLPAQVAAAGLGAGLAYAADKYIAHKFPTDADNPPPPPGLYESLLNAAMGIGGEAIPLGMRGASLFFNKTASQDPIALTKFVLSGEYQAAPQVGLKAPFRRKNVAPWVEQTQAQNREASRLQQVVGTEGADIAGTSARIDPITLPNTLEQITKQRRSAAYRFFRRPYAEADKVLNHPSNAIQPEASLKWDRATGEVDITDTLSTASQPIPAGFDYTPFIDDMEALAQTSLRSAIPPKSPLGLVLNRIVETGKANILTSYQDAHYVAQQLLKFATPKKGQVVTRDMMMAKQAGSKLLEKLDIQLEQYARNYKRATRDRRSITAITKSVRDSLAAGAKSLRENYYSVYAGEEAKAAATAAEGHISRFLGGKGKTVGDVQLALRQGGPRAQADMLRNHLRFSLQEATDPTTQELIPTAFDKTFFAPGDDTMKVILNPIAKQGKGLPATMSFKYFENMVGSEAVSALRRKILDHYITKGNASQWGSLSRNMRLFVARDDPKLMRSIDEFMDAYGTATPEVISKFRNWMRNAGGVAKGLIRLGRAISPPHAKGRRFVLRGADTLVDAAVRTGDADALREATTVIRMSQKVKLPRTARVAGKLAPYYPAIEGIESPSFTEDFKKMKGQAAVKAGKAKDTTLGALEWIGIGKGEGEGE